LMELRRDWELTDYGRTRVRLNGKPY